MEPAAASEPVQAVPSTTDTPSPAPRADADERAVVASTPSPSAPASRGGEPAPSRGCVVEAERVVAEGAERVLVANDKGQLSAVVVGKEGRAFTLFRGASAETLASSATHTLEQKSARVALYAGDLGLRLTHVDEKGKVYLTAVASRAFAPPRKLADGADRRFAPAYAVVNGVELVAFTRTVEKVMHTFLARLAGGNVEVRDVTPSGHGAAAATFVLGHEPPTLVAIDAHAGVSPLLEIPLNERGEAGAHAVRTPVSQPYTPPLLAAVRMPGGSDVQVAYTAVGKLAATAIGRVPLRVATEPVALLPSRGYGELFMAVARGTRRVAFALESPRSETPDAPRSLEVVLLDAEGEGPRSTLAGEGDGIRYPALAVGAREGELWLGYVRKGRATIATLRCDL